MCPPSLHLSGLGQFMTECICNRVRNGGVGEGLARGGGLGLLLYRKNQAIAYLKQTD